MKKVISSALSLSLLLGSLKTSFATETPQMETKFTIKTNFPTQPTAKTPELTKEEKQEIKAEKQALKVEKEFKERLNDSYAEIMEENPCMKVAFKEVSELIKKPDFAKITAKLNELKDEKESLLAYKKNLLETADSKESESVKKQLKNINNRLQAIEYTENCLTKVKKRLQSEGTIFLASLLFIEILFFGLLMITANR